MKPIRKVLVATTALLTSIALFHNVASASDATESAAKSNDAKQCPSALNHSFRRLHSSETVNLCELYSGKPVLIVNTASNCGYTKQFASLEALYKKYKDDGFQIIGFSSNDFNQEAKNEERAAKVCYKNYGVTFTMLAPTSVKGEKANPTFAELTKQVEEPSWNFNKFLLMADGTVTRYGSSTNPVSSSIEVAIKRALN